MPVPVRVTVAARFRSMLALACSTLLLSGCALLPAPTKEPIIVNGNSQFTEERIEAIKTSPTAVFDFTALPMPMTALGLPEESSGTFVATDSDKLITVTMNTPRGVVEMKTDTIRIRPGADHIVDHIDIFINYPNAGCKTHRRDTRLSPVA